ncbi:MAG: DMT family transporter [Maricaulaceae bacterium]
MSMKEISVLIGICFVWGLHFTIIRLTVQDIAEPLFYAASRVGLVALILSPFLKWQKGQMKYIFIGGLGFGSLNYALMFPALNLTTAAAAAIAIELYMPLSIMLSVIFLGERIGRYRILGVALAFLGVIILALSNPNGQVGPYFALGIGMIALAALAESVGAVAVKMTKDIHSLTLLAWFCLTGFCVLAPLSFIIEDNQMEAFTPDNRWKFTAALLYSVLLVSIFAHASYYWLLARQPIYRVACSGVLTTFFGVSMGILILKEPVTLYFVLGGAIAILGVSIILWRNTSHEKSSHPTKSPDGG